MKDNLKAIVVAVALFCALYALFWALAVPYPQPAQKKPPETRSVVVWV
jgi:hypothetical protein